MPEYVDWRELGACRTADPDLFFPVGTTGPARRDIEAAKKICRSCDVIEQCLDWAQDTRQDYGIWGGLTEDERRASRRRSERIRRPVGRTAVSTPIDETLN